MRPPDPATIDREQWKNLTTGYDRLGKLLFEEFGVDLVFHPHADTHVDTQERVERFLADTDPRYVNLCLDTGHISYCDGDNVEIVRRFPERIRYVHLKQVDPAVRDRVRAEKLSLAEAVPLGVMVEPPYGEPAMPPLLDALAGARHRPLHRGGAGPLPGASRTSRCPSAPARPATSPAAVSARSGAGPTDPSAARRCRPAAHWKETR